MYQGMMYTSAVLHCMELVIIADRRIWKASTRGRAGRGRGLTD